MDNNTALDIQFLLGPPADPDLRSRFESSQKGSSPDTSEQRCLELEPRLAVLLAERQGGPSLMSELFSLVLGTPVRVAAPFLSFGNWGGVWVAAFQIRPDDVVGPPKAVARLFEESGLAQDVAAALGLTMKLDWVRTVRSLPDEGEEAERSRVARRT
jgi:hypothetical protein